MFKKYLGLINTKRSVILFHIFWAFLYYLLFRLVYVKYLYEDWAYMGFKLDYDSTLSTFLAILFSIIPILFYEAKKCVSDFVSILLYLVVYVPSIIALQYSFPLSFSLKYFLSFCFASILFFSASRFGRKIRGSLRNGKSIPFSVYGIIAILICIILLIAYRGNLHLVSFSDVYDLRSDNDRIAASNPIIGYLQLWSANLFAPLFVATGLLRKNKVLILLGFIFALVVYMATGLKAMIIGPVVVCAFYYLFTRRNSDNLLYLFPIWVLLFGFLFYAGKIIDNQTFSLLYGLFFMRTLGIASLNTIVYASVFSYTPFTYYSHIRVVNAITGQYPFSDPSFGTAVYMEFLGSNRAANANANFLITDGLAACGVLGIIMIAFFFFFLLCLLNKLSLRHDVNFVMAFLSPLIMALMNVSLFTTLLSCGLLFAILILRFSKFGIPTSTKLNYK